MRRAAVSRRLRAALLEKGLLRLQGPSKVDLCNEEGVTTLTIALLRNQRFRLRRLG